ncbi:glycosyl hydrolases family 31-domain-containing protein [Gigaspora margarita]|uniref:Glucosidase II subunit alpha n=1 Tax=Gigaspora margarita TaxID=4874 RepID=A0A8H4A422_GIGMA|nr:glycosyl hydrolases family 31-domain-containing protein [Gigaspora margarita]
MENVQLTNFFSNTVNFFKAFFETKRRFQTQSSFCRLNRAYADKASANPSFVSPYSLINDSIIIKDGIISGCLINSENNLEFIFELYILEIGAVRIRINEKNPLKPRYDKVKDWALVQDPLITLEYNQIPSKAGVTSFSFGKEKNQTISIYHSPFRVEFLVDDIPTIILNDRGFLNFEHLRDEESNTESPSETNQSSSKNSVQNVGTSGDKLDPKLNGPGSIGLDISFPGYSHVYGIPQHASSLSLKETRGGTGAYSDPYRLYNLDIFGYAIDSPQALYGSIPFMMAHRKGASAAILWLNASETWVDVTKCRENKNNLFGLFNSGKSINSTSTHWFSESGIVDVFFFLGKSSSEIFHQYGLLTGFTSLPQYFGISYHQCRWNYLDQKDVAEVDEGFDRHDIPYDVLWLDIEHTDGKRYFTWDIDKFPDPEKMQKDLMNKGRKMVTIIDPHIKRDEDYYVYKEASDLDLFVKKSSGSVYDGICWPGSSSWIDFTNPLAQEWWSKKFAFDQYKGSTEGLFTWNDMNEPSVFDSPELTMPKDLIHHGGWEHRDLHNIYGFAYHKASTQGLINRTEPPRRPFVLSRAFFVGSQRYGPIWTGDNVASWDYLAISTPMLLTIGISGLPFSGADVGGFSGDPKPELLVRWYQAGAFQPFFRGHADRKTKRREPWLFGDPYTSYIRDIIKERYSLLPLWYTLLYEASTTGMPIIRPMFVVCPDDEKVYEMDDQFFVGNSLLVKPIVEEGQTSTEVYFSGNEIYYDYFTFEQIRGSNKIRIKAPLNKIPVFLRGGSIIPKRQKIRNCSSAMHLDPFTLVIALNENNEATGSLYLDDGETYDYEKGYFVHRQFEFSAGKLASTSLSSFDNDKNIYAKLINSVHVEQIIILGFDMKPSRIIAHCTADSDFELQFDLKCFGTLSGINTSDVLVIKGSNLSITEDWTIEFLK